MNPTARTDDALPVVAPIEPAPPAEDVFRRLAGRPHCLFLDSAQHDPRRGRYSFVAVDPVQFITASSDEPDPLGCLQQALADYPAATIPELPPFQGGAAGLFSYDLCHRFERLPAARFDEFNVPVLAVGIYDVVVALDHAEDRCWIISQGYPEREPAARRRRAAERLRQMHEWLQSDADAAPSTADTTSIVPADELAPQHPVVGYEGLTSDFSPAEYLATVERAIEYIHAGDCFQVNLSQRLLYPAEQQSVALYLRLRRRNPAPFAAYFDLGRFQLASASPERFVQIRNGVVETRPIKGTRPRTARPEADLFAGDELQQSEKDRAENVMIVDLMRSDLSRVCDPASVQVTQLCHLESFRFVQHLVSAVRGRLRDDATPLDLIRAAFPGGSVTGAPKVRAMEIIAELEPTVRGPYCGSLGYLGFDGALDLSILIRTITAGRGWWQLPVGGGIVAQSVPRLEYEETWHKAEGLIRALRP